MGVAGGTARPPRGRSAIACSTPQRDGDTPRRARRAREDAEPQAAIGAAGRALSRRRATCTSCATAATPRPRRTSCGATPTMRLPTPTGPLRRGQRRCATSAPTSDGLATSSCVTRTCSPTPRAPSAPSSNTSGSRTTTRCARDAAAFGAAPVHTSPQSPQVGVRKHAGDLAGRARRVARRRWRPAGRVRLRHARRSRASPRPIWRTGGRCVRSRRSAARPTSTSAAAVRRVTDALGELCELRCGRSGAAVSTTSCCRASAAPVTQRRVVGDAATRDVRDHGVRARRVPCV